MNERPQLQPNRYKDGKAIIQKLRELHAANQLPPLTEQLLFADHRPAEELYDLTTRPHEIHNLAADPQYKSTLEALQKQLIEWETRTNDQGRQPEPTAMYDSDMQEYLKGNGPKKQPAAQNIEQNKQWAAQGK